MTDKIKRLKRKIDRTLNQRHSYDYPPTSGAFVKYKANPVLRREDGGSMFDPFVREVGGELLMCVSNRKNRSLEMYASQDGTEWFLRGELLKATPDTWEDNLNRGCFVIKDGIWYLYYTGQNGDVSKIGLATSEDGVHFIREKSNPIMQPELDFENAAVMNPCVMYDSDQALFRMWYAAGESFEPDVLAYAESKDGVSWTKRPRPIMTADKDLKYQKNKVGACDILRLSDGSYCMAYIAYQNTDVARICLAYSDDGISGWRGDEANPILSPEENSWDSKAVYKPSMCIRNGKWMLWYNGRNERQESIGLAVKKEM